MRRSDKKTIGCVPGMLAACLAMGVGAGPRASADLLVSYGSSSADELSSNLNASILGVSVLNGSVGPTGGYVSGVAPGAYSKASTSGADTSGISYLTTSAASISSLASSTVDNSTGSKTTTASNAETGLSLTLNNLLSSVVSVSASKISSTATVYGGGSTPLTATGSSSFSGLAITLLGQKIDLSGYNGQANDVVYSLGGITITLNEQIPSPTVQNNSKGITVEAIDIAFRNAAVGEYLGNAINLTGNIIIGQSSAAMAVPGPSSVLMLAPGLLGGMGLLARLRRRPAGAMA